jgi:hypothetical protein
VAHSSRRIPPIDDQTLGTPGQPLDPAPRAFMERRIGYDLSVVRVHTGARAAASAEALGASAYTFGSDIVFAAGAFSPSTRGGQRLLAHELTHVAQQRGHRLALSAQSLESVSSPSDASEREADAAADAVVAGQQVTLSTIPAAGQVHRDTKEYQTEGSTLDTVEMGKWPGRSYWEQKIFEVLAVTNVSPADTRLKVAEERDAVYSVIWDTYQTLKPVKTETERTVDIPPVVWRPL